MSGAFVSRWSFVGLACAVACGDGTSILFPTGGSLVLIGSDDEDRRSMEAYERPFPTPIKGEGRRFVALFFSGDLTSIGLEAGPLLESAEGHVLPIAETIFEATAEDPGWRSLDAVPPDIETIRVLGLDPCIDYEVDDYVAEGPSPDTLAFAVSASAAAALVAIGDRLYVADMAGARRVDPRGALLEAAWRDVPRDRIWTFGGGAATRGNLQGGFQPVAAPPVRPIALDGSRGTAPEELFALTSSLALWRFDGSAWAEVAPPAGTIEPRSAATLAWAGPDHAFYTGIATDRLFEYRNGQRRTIVIQSLVGSADNDGLSYVRNVEGWGPLLGTRSGAVLRQRDGGDWPEVVQPTSSTRVYAIEALGQGLLYGGEDGLLHQFQPPDHQCPPRKVVSVETFDIATMVELDAGFLVFEQRPPGSELIIGVVTR